MNEYEKKLVILSSIRDSVFQILIDNDVDLQEISKFLKPINKEIEFLKSKIPPEKILCNEMIKLVTEFKSKLDVGVHLVVRD